VVPDKDSFAFLLFRFVGYMWLFNQEAYSPFWSFWLRLWGFHQLTDRVKNHPELSIVFLFQGIKFTSQIGMGCKYSSKTNERSHDLYVHPNGAFAPKDTGEHGHALFCESIRPGAAETSPT
jgi:hypothetical protein